MGLLLCLLLSAPVMANGLSDFDFEYAGDSHSFLFYSPFLRSPGYGQLPAVIVLHGDNASHNDMLRLTFGRFNELADEEEFYVVYPQAPDNHWLTGVQHNLDMIQALANELPGRYPVDRSRIYVVGMASGGALALQLACSGNQPFKAVAAVSAGLPKAVSGACKTATQATPAMLINASGSQKARDKAMLSARRTIRLLRKAGDCSRKHTRLRPDDRFDDGTRVIRLDYTDCAPAAGVAWLKIDGGGHTWPDGWQYRPVSEVGQTSREISAAAEVWSFFSDKK